MIKKEVFKEAIRFIFGFICCLIIVFILFLVATILIKWGNLWLDLLFPFEASQNINN